MAVQVTIPDAVEAELRRLTADQNISLEEALLSGVVLLLAADQRLLYLLDQDDPHPDPHGQPTRFVRVSVSEVAQWIGWGTPLAPADGG